MSEVRVLRRITDELAQASGDLDDGEATALWAAVAGLSPAEVWLRRESEAAPDVVSRFRMAVAQRKRGVPFAYVAGSVGPLAPSTTTLQRMTLASGTPISSSRAAGIMMSTSAPKNCSRVMAWVPG